MASSKRGGICQKFIWQTMKPLYRTNDIVTSLCDDSCNLR